MPSTMEDAYYHEVDDILEQLDVKPDIGLDEDRVEKRREEFGWNGRICLFYHF